MEAVSKVSWNLNSRSSNILQRFFVKKSDSDILKYNHSERKKKLCQSCKINDDMKLNVCIVVILLQIFHDFAVNDTIYRTKMLKNGVCYVLVFKRRYRGLLFLTCRHTTLLRHRFNVLTSF